MRLTPMGMKYTDSRMSQQIAAVSQNGTLSHRDLIHRGGGPAKFGDSLEPPVSGNTVKAWSLNDSIPGPYWQSIADAKLATLEELAAAAEAKRRAAPANNGTASQ